MHDSRISLDGTWEFLHVADDRLSGPAEVRRITVPSPWQAQFADLRMRAGIGIYRRAVDIPEEWLTDSIWLRFGAVFHNTRVFVNGELVGTNEGGFLPFSFDVTAFLKPGRNEIKVRVDSADRQSGRIPDSPFAEIPFGKQSWYGPLSGIWQSVLLERRIPDHMTRMRLVPNRETGRVTAGVFFARPLTTPSRSASRSSIRGQGGARRVRHAGRRHLDALRVRGRGRPVLVARPSEPLSHPARTSSATRSRTTSRTRSASAPSRPATASSTSTASRSTSAAPSTRTTTRIRSAPCRRWSSSEDQFRKAKELGLNCLRCHIKAADPRYYEVADRIGMLIWTELPNGGMSTDRSRGARRSSSRASSTATATTRRSSSGRSSTRTGASTSSTTPTIATG